MITSQALVESQDSSTSNLFLAKPSFLCSDWNSRQPILSTLEYRKTKEPEFKVELAGGRLVRGGGGEFKLGAQSPVKASGHGLLTHPVRP